MGSTGNFRALTGTTGGTLRGWLFHPDVLFLKQLFRFWENRGVRRVGFVGDGSGTLVGLMYTLRNSTGTHGGRKVFILRKFEVYDSTLRGNVRFSGLVVSRATRGGCRGRLFSFCRGTSRVCGVPSDLFAGVDSAGSPRNIVTLIGVPSGGARVSGGNECVTLRGLGSPSGLKTISHATRTLNIDNVVVSNSDISPCSPGSLHTSVNALLHVPMVVLGSFTNRLGGSRLGVCTYIISESTGSVGSIGFGSKDILIVNGRTGNLASSLGRVTSRRVAVAVHNGTRSLGTTATTTVSV